LKERLGICVADLRGQRDPAVAGPLTRAVQEIVAVLREGKTGPAASLIDVLETPITEATPAARQATVGTEVGQVVDFAKPPLRWRDAQAAFDANRKAIGAILLVRPEIQADPRHDLVRQAVAAFHTLEPNFGGALEAALDAGISATDPAEKVGLAHESSAAIEAYRDRLRAATGLVELVRFAASDLGASRRPLDEFDDALAELKQHVAGRA
jgi:hypothetical protein